MNELRDVDLEPMNEFELTLVSSAKSEGMTADRKRALALMLAGGAAAAATTATVGGTAVAAGTAKVATAAAATKSTTAGLVILKWVAAGIAGSALAIGATTGAIHVYEAQRATSSSLANAPSSSSSSATIRVASTASPASTAPAPPAPLSVATMVAPDPPIPPAIAEKPVAIATPTPQAIAKAPVVGARAPAAAPPSPPSSPRSISDELRTIERARGALAANDTSGAARALDEHDQLFASGGALAEEARVLRIDLHAKRGERERAHTEARAFLAAHPESPHAPRLRSIAAASDLPGAGGASR